MIKAVLRTLTIMLLIFAVACARRVDVSAEQAALLRLDSNWAAAASSGEVDRIASFWSDDAVIYAPNFPVLTGKEALREFVSRNRSLPGFSITWTPETAVVSASGDIGYTLGPYEITMPLPGNQPVTVRGTYLSTWRRQADGQWKCTLEIHSPKSNGTPSREEAGSALRLVLRLMDVWGMGDTATLDEITSPDVVYDDVPNGQRFVGREGMRRYIRHVHAWASQVNIKVTRVHGGASAAVAEWVMSGIQDRPIPDRVPVATKRTFELKEVTLIEVRDGRITKAADYMDVLGFLLQLGGRVELPGGKVLPKR